jgi:two-component system cell cycle response regulator DivK
MHRILLVEDEEPNRDIFQRRLRKRGFEVLGAADGAEAVARARADRPDLILMDVQMPVLDGWAATRQLKAAPDTRAIPVIAMTAHAMDAHRQMAVEAGCDGFHDKLGDIDRLVEQIQELLSRGPARGVEAP